MNPVERTSPPRAPLLLRIGVTGHRPERDDIPPDKRKRPVASVTAVEKAITQVLEVIRNSFRGVATSYGHLSDLHSALHQRSGGGVIRIISSLAAGADQWVVEKAVNPPFRFELQVILPFCREEYRKDFEDSGDEETFFRLLDLSSATIEMDGITGKDGIGKRKPDSRSYEAAGRAMLNQTDLLIAVWDGQEARGRGGTGQVVREALQKGIPVVWIPWNSPEKWCLQNTPWRLPDEPEDFKGDSELLSETVKKLLLQKN